MIQGSQETACSPYIFHKCLGSQLDRDFERTSSHIETRYEEILAYSGNNLPHEGELLIDDRGFFYINLPNAYIFDLCLLLNRKEIDLPPYFFETFKGGAHISVALPEEKKSLYALPELGKMIPFEITGCFYTEPQNLKGFKKIWYLSVDCPAIPVLREKMGLSPNLLGQEPHITFAIEKQFLCLEDYMTECDDMSISMKPLKITKEKIRRIMENPSYLK